MAKILSAQTLFHPGQIVGNCYEILRLRHYAQGVRSYEATSGESRVRIRQVLHCDDIASRENLARAAEKLNSGQDTGISQFHESFSDDSGRWSCFVFVEQTGPSLCALLQSGQLSADSLGQYLEQMALRLRNLEELGLLDFIGQIEAREIRVGARGRLFLQELPILSAQPVLRSADESLARIRKSLKEFIGHDCPELHWLLSRTENRGVQLEQESYLEGELELVYERPDSRFLDEYYGYLPTRKPNRGSNQQWAFILLMLLTTLALFNWTTKGDKPDLPRGPGFLLARGSGLYWQGQTSSPVLVANTWESVSDLILSQEADRLYVSDSASATLTILNSQTLMTEGEVPLWSPLDRLEFLASQDILVGLAEEGRHLAVIDLKSSEPKVLGSINVGNPPQDFDLVSRLNLETGERTARLVATSQPDGWIGVFQVQPKKLICSRNVRGVGAVAWNPTRSEIYVAVAEERKILVLSADDLKTLQIIDGLEASALRVCRDGDFLLASNGSHSIREVHLPTRELGRVFELPMDTLMVDLGRDDEPVIFTAGTPSRLTELDPKTFVPSSRELGMAPETLKRFDMNVKGKSIAP